MQLSAGMPVISPHPPRVGGTEPTTNDLPTLRVAVFKLILATSKLRFVSRSFT